LFVIDLRGPPLGGQSMGGQFAGVAQGLDQRAGLLVTRGAMGADLSGDRDRTPRRAYIEPPRQPASLEALDTGDAQIQTVIGKLRKV
ncbi:hypothetical protein K4G97_24120, partial [Mycobacterium tuberculosis]|nr:hypothetical protein [Mycobacterium tuberculosis]